MPRGEFNVSIEKFGALAMVMIVLIVVAYRIGISHGEEGISTNDSASLSKNVDESRPTYDRDRPHFAIKAETLPFTELTRESAKREAGRLLKSLWDAGYGDAVHAWRFHDDDETSGQIVIWVGHAQSRKELQGEARAVRALQSSGGAPFKDAYITLFSPPK